MKSLAQDYITILAERDALQREIERLREALERIADDGFENSRDRRTLIAKAALYPATSPESEQS